jgi:hypothetical protein
MRVLERGAVVEVFLGGVRGELLVFFGQLHGLLHRYSRFPLGGRGSPQVLGHALVIGFLSGGLVRLHASLLDRGALLAALTQIRLVRGHRLGEARVRGAADGVILRSAAAAFLRSGRQLHFVDFRLERVGLAFLFRFFAQHRTEILVDPAKLGVARRTRGRHEREKEEREKEGHDVSHYSTVSGYSIGRFPPGVLRRMRGRKPPNARTFPSVQSVDDPPLPSPWTVSTTLANRL